MRCSAVWSALSSSAAGVEGVNFAAVITKILVPALVSPIVAGLAAFCAVKLIFAVVKHMSEKQVESGFRHGQTVTACLVALSHGTNDAQKPWASSR